MTATRNIPFGRPWIGEEERQAVLEVLDGPILTHGPKGRAFEEEFAGFLGGECHCVTVSSCMAALHLAYFHLGLGPGDQVIVPAMTHVATAHAVELVGAEPVFVDCDPLTGNIDPQQAEAALTDRTRAFSLVHFLGIPCDMEKITALTRKHGLLLIEDCALALGTEFDGKAASLFGDVGCFSFYPVKHITTAEGGMFVTTDKKTAELAAQKRAFGVDRTHTQRKTPGVYDVNMLGLNSRMSELQAALGLCQTARLPEILKRRRANFKRLRSGLDGIGGIRIIGSADKRALSSDYCLSLVLQDGLAGKRAGIIEELNRSGVGTSVYYPHPVPRLTYYRERYGYRPGRFPHAEEVADQSIALPVGPHLDENDMDYIAERFRAAAVAV